MPMRYPRYTTFGDDELVAANKLLVPDGQPVPDARTLRALVNGASVSADGTGIAGATTGGRRPLLIKEQFCPVAYPDGAAGVCRYVRIGPEWHLFHYRHQGKVADENECCQPAPAADSTAFRSGVPLPTQYIAQRMGNTRDAIAAVAKEQATSAFRDAVLHEQKDRFRRATPPGGSKIDPAAYQFSAKRAKEVGGHYALCRLLEKRLLPDGPLFAALEDANAAWRERDDQRLFVACACRWTRRWELPRFNPLYREFPPPSGV